MKIYNPISRGADIDNGSFVLKKGEVKKVSDVTGLAILKQWGFLEEVPEDFVPPTPEPVEAPKTPVSTPEVAEQPTEEKVAVKPVKKATKEKPAKKAVKVAKKIAKPTLSKKKVKSKK